MAFMQKGMLIVPIWTTRQSVVARIFHVRGEVGSMNTLIEHDLEAGLERHCRFLAFAAVRYEFWQSRQALGYFKNPVALTKRNHHLRRSLIEGDQDLRSESEGLKPAQGHSCALLRNRGRTRGMLGVI
jgi:hypothetical protein